MTKDYKAEERRHYGLQISFSIMSFKNEEEAYEITSPSVSVHSRHKFWNNLADFNELQHGHHAIGGDLEDVFLMP
jgi:hypothetical protein